MSPHHTSTTLKYQKYQNLITFKSYKSIWHQHQSLPPLPFTKQSFPEEQHPDALGVITTPRTVKTSQGAVIVNVKVHRVVHGEAFPWVQKRMLQRFKELPISQIAPSFLLDSKKNVFHGFSRCFLFEFRSSNIDWQRWFIGWRTQDFIHRFWIWRAKA